MLTQCRNQPARFIRVQSVVLLVQKVTGDNVGTEIRNILKEVDKNGDGRIDYEEFCDMMRQAGAFLCYVCGRPAV